MTRPLFLNASVSRLPNDLSQSSRTMALEDPLTDSPGCGFLLKPISIPG